MRVSFVLRRPPTLAERLLGRRRARWVRRRLGLAAVATGYSLLRPRNRWAMPVMVVALTTTAVAAFRL